MEILFATCLQKPLLAKKHTVSHQYFQLRLLDKTRTKYKNVEQLSKGEILAMLDSIDSDDEDKMDKLMNDSDTAFVSNKPLAFGPSNSNSGNSVLVAEDSKHVYNMKNTRYGDKGSSAKGKTELQKTNGQRKWKFQSQMLDKIMECVKEAKIFVDIN